MKEIKYYTNPLGYLNQIYNPDRVLLIVILFIITRILGIIVGVAMSGILLKRYLETGIKPILTLVTFVLGYIIVNINMLLPFTSLE